MADDTKINNKISNSLDIRTYSTNYNIPTNDLSNGSNMVLHSAKENEEYSFGYNSYKIVNKVADQAYDINTLKDPTDNDIPGNIQDLFAMWNSFINDEIVTEVEKKKELNKNKEVNKINERELLNVLSRYQLGLTGRDILYVDSNENKIYLKCGFIINIKNNEIVSINNLQNNVVHELEPGKSYFNKIIMNDKEYMIEPPKDADNDKYNHKKILNDYTGNPIDNCLENLFEKYKIFFCPELDAIVEQKKLQNKSTSNINYSDYKKTLLGYGLNVDDDEITYIDEQEGKVYLKHGGIILHIKDNDITYVESLITHAKYTLENDKTYFNKVELNNQEYSLEPPIIIEDLDYDINRAINPKMIKDELGNVIPNNIQKLYNMSKNFLSPKIEEIVEEQINNPFYFFSTIGGKFLTKIVMDNFPDLNESDILYTNSFDGKVYLKCGLIVKTSLLNGIESIENVDTDTKYILNHQSTDFSMVLNQKNGILYRNDNDRIKNVSIFDSENLSSFQYGGDQGAFRKNAEKLLQDPQIINSLKEYYPDASMEDYHLYLCKLNTCGCGYTALVNTVFNEYKGREAEFEQRFGYPMYTVNSYGDVDYNYEYMILDYFNYIWGNSEYSIQELYGNVSLNAIDGAISGDLNTGKADGTNDDIVRKFSNFLQEKYDCNINIDIGIPDTIYSHYGKINKDNALSIYYNLKTDDNQIVCVVAGYDLYNMDGSLYKTNGGGHAMCITGVTEDGNFIVSSWGKQYILGLDGFAPGFDTEKKGINFEIVEYAN